MNRVATDVSKSLREILADPHEDEGVRKAQIEAVEVATRYLDVMYGHGTALAKVRMVTPKRRAIFEEDITPTGDMAWLRQAGERA